MRVRVVLLGMQGSGKGTVARFMQRELGAVPIGAGDLLRACVAAGGRWADEISSRIDQGRDVPEEISYGLLRKSLAAHAEEPLIVLDGYPRLARQLPLLVAILGGQPDLAIHLDIPRPLAVSRLMVRETCQGCGHPFGPEAPSRISGRCDACGQPLGRRSDDQPMEIARRLETWATESNEILAYFDGETRLRTVNATRPPRAVCEEAVAALRGLPN